MLGYHLNLEQFKEFVAPFIKKINEKFIEKEHKQLDFDITAPYPGSNPCDTYDIDYYVVGYFTSGKVIVSLENCFILQLTKFGLNDIDWPQEAMQEALWQYCYELFGSNYQGDLFQFMLQERERKIKDLKAYIKGLETADITDMNIVNTETNAANDEIAYLEQYYDNALEFINALSVSTCNN